MMTVTTNDYRYGNLSILLYVNLLLLLFCWTLSTSETDLDNYGQQQHGSLMTTANYNKDGDMSLWIDEMQVKQFFNGIFCSSIHYICNLMFVSFCFVFIYRISNENSCNCRWCCFTICFGSKF